MASKRDIFNGAFTIIGDAAITDPDKDDDAGVIRDIYSQVYDNTLLLYPWNDAMRRQSLPLVNEAPAFGFSKKYRLPTSPLVCLRVLMAGGEPSEFFARWGSGVPGRGRMVAPAVPGWKVEGEFILTDFGEPLDIVFIARVNEGSLRGHLAKVMSYEIADEIAFKRTSSARLAELVTKKAESVVSSARSVDAQEGGQVNPWRSDFLDGR